MERLRPECKRNRGCAAALNGFYEHDGVVDIEGRPPPPQGPAAFDAKEAQEDVANGKACEDGLQLGLSVRAEGPLFVLLKADAEGVLDEATASATFRSTFNDGGTSKVQKRRRLSCSPSSPSPGAHCTQQQPAKKSRLVEVGSLTIEEIASIWERRASLGCAHSQHQLALCHERGHGARRDLRRAVALWRLAANQGHGEAQLHLGLAYEKGSGVERNVDSAISYWRLATQQGVAAAQQRLGSCYENGRGVPVDMDEAVKLYKLAVNGGCAAAQFDLGRCYEAGSGVEKNMNEAQRLYRLAAQQGHLLARLSAMFS